MHHHNHPQAPIAPVSQSPSFQGHVPQQQMAGTDITSQRYIPQQPQGLIWQFEDYLASQWDTSPYIQLPQGYMPHELGYYPTVVVQGQTLVPQDYVSSSDSYVSDLLGYGQPAPMHYPQGVYRPTSHSQRQQHPQTVYPRPPLIRQQDLPQPQTQQARPTYLRINADKFLEYTNLLQMFPKGKYHKIQEGYGYVQFASEAEAEMAKTEFSIFKIQIGVDPPSGCPKKSECKLMLESIENDGCSREIRSCQENDRPSAHIVMGWSPFLEFLSKRNKFLVEPQKFSTAAKVGSVDPSVKMAYSTSYGNRFGTGFLHYMGQVHLAGKSWEGVFERNDLVVSTGCLCMIDRFPWSLATYVNILKDLLAIICHLFNLYEINGRKPAYFDDLLEKIRSPPKDMGSLVINVKNLKNFYERLVNHAGFADEKALSILLQEINVNCKKDRKANKTPLDSELPKTVAPTDLVKFVRIDKLLRDVCRKDHNKPATFSEEGEYLRHLVHHSPEKSPDFFPAKERIALVGWYFENFIPLFVDVMFENKENRDWLQELQEIYKKEDFELGAMQFDDICSLIEETVVVDPAREDVVGVGLRNNLSGKDEARNLWIGLRNRPGENNCFLNVTVQMLFHVEIFRERLLKMDDLAEHPILYELNSLFKGLVGAAGEPGEILTASHLRTALGPACPKEHFEDGREHEASLALKLILDSVHLASGSEPGVQSCSCSAHDIFGLDGMEWKACPCGSTSDMTAYMTFSMSARVSSLLKSMKGCQDVSFADHLNKMIWEDEFCCTDDGCQKKNHLYRSILASPYVCTIEIEWTPGDEDVEVIMNAMSAGVDLGALYEYLDRGTIYFPVSIACFSGMHCICFILQDDVWVMFNDLKVKAVGSWVDLISICVAGGWKPTLVFFQPAIVQR